MMIRLLVLLLLGSGLWSGYWFAGSSYLRQAADQWFADQAARGLTAEKSSLTVAGFPNRFDLRVEDMVLQDPASGIGWTASFAEVFAMTWKPWHIIAALPPDQTLALPDQTIQITSEALRTSLRAKPDLDVPLANAAVETGALTARSSQGWSISVAKGFISFRDGADAATEIDGLPASATAANAYVLQLDLSDLSPDEPRFARIANEAGLPPGIEVVRLLAVAALTAPLDRNAPQTSPRLAAAELADTLIRWGELSATASGTIQADDQGFAAGRIDISLTNWQPIVPALVAAGAVKPELSDTIRNMLAALAKDGGDENVLKLPLVLTGGAMSLGPLPLGPAPLLLPPSG
jgi:hypothetical protein